MRTSAAGCAASQPLDGATPPLVSARRMKDAVARPPVPSWLLAFNRSQGIAPAAGASARVTTSPTTEAPSLVFQVGPAKCVATRSPFLSNRLASGALRTHSKPAPFAVQL